MRSGTQRILFTLLAALALTTGCSSSQTSGDSGLPLDEESSSSADAVGSIPEDMLAADESGSADAETGAAGAEVAGAAKDVADPFADLTESADAADAASEVDVAAAATGETAEYTVKSGDTLMKIAFSLYGDIDRWKDLEQWNRASLKNANRLKPGTRLTYETPAVSFSPEERAHTYEIKKGDTLANIADEVYGRKAKYKKLQGYNKSLIKNPNRIFAGFTIFYDITPQEMAEAEQRRQERAASAGSVAPAPEGGAEPASDGQTMSMVPSAVAPPADMGPPQPAPMANTPAAVPAPASANQ